jgi:spore coat protein U-like protein
LPCNAGKYLDRFFEAEGAKVKSKLKAAIGIASIAATGIVAAATSTSTFQVSANVANSCSASASDLAFGTYDPLAALPTDGISTVTVQCTLLTNYTIGLSAGAGAGASVATRKMTKGADTLNYSLYQDAAHLVVWGQTPGTDTVSGVGTGLAVPHIVYGRIPPTQNVNAGAYLDTITVSINY